MYRVVDNVCNIVVCIVLYRNSGLYIGYVYVYESTYGIGQDLDTGIVLNGSGEEI